MQDGYEANTDAQTLSLLGTDITITGGNSLDLSSLQDGYEANTDAQELDFSANVLSISGGSNTFDLSSYLDNTDAQELLLTGSDLSISGGNTIDLSTLPSGTDDQTLDLTANVLSIEDGNTVELTAYLDNTDEQDLVDAVLTGTVLQIDIENGSSVSVDLYPLIEDLEARITTLEGQVGIKNTEYTSARLFQNVPNPYKDNTIINFYIPKSVANAQMVIYNIKGEIINELPIYQRENGNIVFTKDQLSVGTYFYTLILDGHKLDSKVMVQVN